MIMIFTVDGNENEFFYLLWTAFSLQIQNQSGAFNECHFFVICHPWWHVINGLFMTKWFVRKKKRISRFTLYTVHWTIFVKIGVQFLFSNIFPSCFQHPRQRIRCWYICGLHWKDFFFPIPLSSPRAINFFPSLFHCFDQSLKELQVIYCI